MKVKTFSGSGKAGIQEVEYAVNEWLTAQAAEIRVSDQHTAMCTVADSGSGVQSPYVLVTIWYAEKGGREQGQR